MCPCVTSKNVVRPSDSSFHSVLTFSGSFQLDDLSREGGRLCWPPPAGPSTANPRSINTHFAVCTPPTHTKETVESDKRTIYIFVWTRILAKESLELKFAEAEQQGVETERSPTG
jgi:hypothetical protein